MLQATEQIAKLTRTEMKTTATRGIPLSLAIIFIWSSLAVGQTYYKVEAFRELADSGSKDTIAPGTKITAQNWREFKRFLPIWLQAAYSGHYHWKIGSDSDYTITVGQTQHYRLPRKFQEDTEKYAGQTQLVKLPEDGSYTVKGYVAGVPFPNPTQPDLGPKILYNHYYFYEPQIQYFDDPDYIVDRYGNVAEQVGVDVLYRFTHLSEPNLPTNIANSQGWFRTTYFTVTAPEQSRYVTQMMLQDDDPKHAQEVFLFVPSLRRSLRLSNAARCSPVLGLDYTNDDAALMPTTFKPVFLGEKKVLERMSDGPNGHKISAYLDPRTRPDVTFPDWPADSGKSGHWELRDEYIVDLQKLPSFGNYCFPHRVYYIDSESYIAMYKEEYDRAGQLQKFVWAMEQPVKVHDERVLTFWGFSGNPVVDFQNGHSTYHVSDGRFDEDVPEQYQNYQEYGFPDALSRVMK
jgi:hypothetical protein